MRKQYHFRRSTDGLQAWDVNRLIAIADALPEQAVPLNKIAEVETTYWFDPGCKPTVRAVVDHVRLINDADLAYAIILGPDGRVMDGMHRVAKAILPLDHHREAPACPARPGLHGRPALQAAVRRVGAQLRTPQNADDAEAEDVLDHVSRSA